MDHFKYTELDNLDEQQGPDIEVMNKLYLELSQFCNAETYRERCLRQEYNKLSRILSCIINKHDGVISKLDWEWINGLGNEYEFVPYSLGINADGDVVIDTNVARIELDEVK